MDVFDGYVLSVAVYVYEQYLHPSHKLLLLSFVKQPIDIFEL